MDDFDRKQYIDDFLIWLGCGGPYQSQYPLSLERANALAEDYFDAVRRLSDERVKTVIDRMKKDIEALLQRRNRHGRLDAWKNCCQGVADYLLRPKAIDAVNRTTAAGALYQLSGYVCHCAGFFGTFVDPAVAIADVIWGEGVLQNEHTGGPVTLDPASVTDGLITIWELAKGQRLRFARSEHEIRYLASRLLNFLCLEGYGTVGALEGLFPHLANAVDGRSWAVDSHCVDVLTQNGRVAADWVVRFLERHGFDRNETYNPRGLRRHAWFEQNWAILE